MPPTSATPTRLRRADPIALRLAVTVFLVYVLHFASNVVRETYLAITLGESLSIRVDDYLGLHPDLFAIPGRGAYINNNPGASMLAAVPYAVAAPGIALLFRVRPDLAQPRPPSTYADPRPNRTKFLNASRARGLDVKLFLAAVVTQVGLMAPLGALAAVVLFGFLRHRLRDERAALWLALLYAFGTPVFFRSAFLNQNLIVAHCVLFAFVALVPPRREDGDGAGRAPAALLGAGGLLGLAVLCDYSGVSLLAAFGLWVLARGARAAGAAGGLRDAALLAAGAAVPLAVLALYQWRAFGDPLLPAQRYMPPTFLSVRGWNGLSLPSAELLWRNLIDPAYGLFAFCPMLAAAVAAPFVRPAGGRTRWELALIFGASTALYLFSSANQYALLQWNTGVRYLVPAGPLLFIALVPVLLALPVWGRALLVLPTAVISWCLAMAREDVPTSLLQVLLGGFQLPFLTVLRKTAAAYAPFLTQGVSPLPLFAIAAVILWLVWRRAKLARPAAVAGEWPEAAATAPAVPERAVLTGRR